MNMADHKERVYENLKKQYDESVQELRFYENGENKVVMREVQLKAYDVALEQNLDPEVREEMELDRESLVRMIDDFEQNLEDQKLRVKVNQALLEAFDKF
ncbi:hypothetical protein ON064_00575 [Planococcus sp. A6]|uniref:hypothetical protein n=1 Tax=Planococcus sp. A6 TaxID=2992760 RepID=UPI00237A22C0|nr:hypothetical protein [Planococcus sp. A6]MDE0581543.1 hypothetical protein [Planococcus sp. A6]